MTRGTMLLNPTQKWMHTTLLSTSSYCFASIKNGRKSSRPSRVEAYSCPPNDDLDESHYRVWSTNTTSYMYLERYWLEDMLACDKDYKVLMCLHETMDKQDYCRIILDQSMDHALCSVGGETCKIFGRTYY